MASAHSHHHRTPLVHKRAKKVDDVRSEINVTPLVDVCLVLLIIFLVVTDKLSRGKEVQLPKAKNANVQREGGDELIVSLTKDGPNMRIWWDRDPLLDLSQLRKRAEDEIQRRSRPIFIKADSDLTYGDVYPILMAVHDAGSPGVQLGTQELKENK